MTKLSKKIMGWFFLRHSVESIKLNQSINKLFTVAKVTKINCKQGELSYKLTPCFFKTPLYDLLNNSVKNEPILIIVGTQIQKEI